MLSLISFHRFILHTSIFSISSIPAMRNHGDRNTSNRSIAEKNGAQPPTLLLATVSTQYEYNSVSPAISAGTWIRRAPSKLRKAIIRIRMTASLTEPNNRHTLLKNVIKCIRWFVKARTYPLIQSTFLLMKCQRYPIYQSNSTVFIMYSRHKYVIDVSYPCMVYLVDFEYCTRLSSLVLV